ncbi:MAG: tetratricopeptide repeat protein [Nitrospirota bacterium]
MNIGKMVFWMVITAYLLPLCACALPRIVILDDPLSPEEHVNLGVAYEKKGDLDIALKEYTAAAKKLPLAHLYMGNIYFKKGEFELAERYYKAAIEKDPANADAYNNLAWLYYTERKNLDVAEKYVRRAIDLNPARSEIYHDTLEKLMSLKEEKIK